MNDFTKPEAASLSSMNIAEEHEVNIVSRY